MPESNAKKALIVGAGPVGSLTALSLHKRGWQVEVWEGRTDPRESSTAPENLRSINLAISARGITSLRSVDPALADELLKEAIPMKGRMIHHAEGARREAQAYDPKGGECINSLPRPLLNLRLIESLPQDITIHFSTKIASIDWASRTAHAKPSKSDKNTIESVKPGEPEKANETERNPQAKGKICEFDLIVGCDGSWSKVRQEMMRVEKMDFKQSFIDHEYVELHMPPKREASEEAKGKQVGEGEFLMEMGYLHIWPREKFMLIALPNKDGSFTLTLFCPRATLLDLDTREKARRFFHQNFPDAIEWAGEDRILSDFEKNPRGGLVTINVKPSHHLAPSSNASAILLGDASHSMVPFYGQGLNCGLEDVRVFNSMLQKHGVDSVRSADGKDEKLGSALKEYSEVRNGDLEAIVELAMENYTEMRSKVVSPAYHLRRVLDSVLSHVLPPPARKEILLPQGPAVQSKSTPPPSTTEPFPTARVNGWSSLYTMVTFRPDVSYQEALRKEKAQRDIVQGLAWGLGGGVGLAAMGGLVWGALYGQKYLQSIR